MRASKEYNMQRNNIFICYMYFRRKYAFTVKGVGVINSKVTPITTVILIFHMYSHVFTPPKPQESRQPNSNEYFINLWIRLMTKFLDSFFVGLLI